MKLRARLASLGGFVAVTGLVGLVSRWVGARFEVVAWMDGWGRGNGTAIRWGLLVGGLALVVVGALERAPVAGGAEPALDERDPGTDP